LTICLPGLSPDGNLFCYTSFLNENFIIVMITDESFEKFYDFSSVRKAFKEEFFHSEAFTKATAALSKPVYDFDMGLDKIKMLKHFLVKHNDLNQLVMSSYNYFGQNDQQFKGILNTYAEVQRLQLIANCNRKQKMHLEKRNESTVGVYTTGVYSIFFSGVESLSLDEVKVILEGLFKWLKE
jgi:hypothetical protein